MNFRFHDSAKREYEESAIFYQNRQSGLGVEFVEEVESAISRILADPESLPLYPQEETIRYCQTRRFPYLVVFEKRNDEIEIVAVMSGSRRPGYWKNRRK